MTTFERQILEWLFTSDDTGSSSECLAAVMLGFTPSDNSIPYDPSDFCRCLKLIRAAPNIRYRLPEMRKVSKSWGKIIDHWKEIEDSFMAEVPGWLEGKDTRKAASRTYEIMARVRE